MAVRLSSPHNGFGRHDVNGQARLDSFHSNDKSAELTKITPVHVGSFAKMLLSRIIHPKTKGQVCADQNRPNIDPVRVARNCRFGARTGSKPEDASTAGTFAATTWLPDIELGIPEHSRRDHVIE